MEFATSGCAASVFSTWSKNKMFTSPFFRVNIRKPTSPACPYICSRPREACMTQTLCWAWLPEEHNDTFHNKILCFLVLPPSHLRFLWEGFRFPSYSPRPHCEHTRKGVTLVLQLYKVPGPLLVLNVCAKLTSFWLLWRYSWFFHSDLLFISLSLKEKGRLSTKSEWKKFVKYISYFIQYILLFSSEPFILTQKRWINDHLAIISLLNMWALN